MREFINREYLYMVVGATGNPESEGFRVLNNLKEKGYQVIALSPYSSEINGIKCFETILDLEERPDVVLIATPPLESQAVVNDSLDFGLDHFWFQPDCCSLEFFNKLNSEGVMFVADRDICAEL